MGRWGKETKTKPEGVIKEAVKFFGPDGCGLTVTENAGTHAAFEGGGGHVHVAAKAVKKGASVDVESVEWDHQAEQFLNKIK